MKRAYIDLILQGNEPDMIAVSQITDGADYNRSTFYFHCRNKEELLEDMFNDVLEGIRAAVKHPFQKNRQANDRDIEQITFLICSHIESNRKIFRALAKVHANPSLFLRMEKLLYDVFMQEYTVHKEVMEQSDCRNSDRTCGSVETLRFASTNFRPLSDSFKKALLSGNSIHLDIHPIKWKIYYRLRVH